jgi:ABC-type transport system involved in multi-copper enzyme maturation permease subunit
MAFAGSAGSLLRGRLVAAEILKIRTTRAWWLFAGSFTLASALAAVGGWESSNSVLHPTLSDYPAGASRDAVIAQAVSARTASGAAELAASMMTSGQFLLLLITLLLGVHVATSEYSARTVTSTFLAEPRRSRVVLAKVIVSVLFGVAFWAIATVLDGVATPFFLTAEHLPASAFSSPAVLRADAMGLLAFVLWALFGLGLGAALRSQVIAVAAAIAAYAGGFLAVELTTHLLYGAFHAPWLLSLAVLAPAQASSVMITAGRAFPHAPPWWAGALVLAGYGMALTALGTASVSRSDVA